MSKAFKKLFKHRKKKQQTEKINISKKKEEETSIFEPKEIKLLNPHSAEVRCVFISEDNCLYSGSFANDVIKHKLKNDSFKKIWQTKTSSYIFSLSIYLGRLYATGSSIFCFDPKNGDMKWSYSKGLNGYSFVNVWYKGSLFVGGADTFLRKFQLDNNEELIEIQKVKNNGRIWSIKFYDDKLYTSSSNGSIIEWDYETFQQRRLISGSPVGAWGLEISNSVIFSCGKDGEIQTIDLPTGNPIRKFNEKQSAIIDSCLYKNLLFTSGDSGVVFCFNILTEKLVARFKTEAKNWTITVSNDRLYAGTTSSKIYVFDIAELNPFNCLSQDLKQLFSRQELCDNSIQTLEGTVNFHDYFVRKRLEIENINKFQSVFLSKKQEEIETFFEWIYTGFTKNNELVSGILKEMSINFFNQKNNQKALQKDLKKMYEDDDSKEFTIFVDSKPIKIHKFILLSRSDLYRGMFLSVTEDNSNKVTDYSGKSFKAVGALVYFLYLGKLPKYLKKSTLEELQDAIDYYQLNENSNLPTEIEKLLK